ncbi:hypothetical protein GCM10023317_93990 [Actinopolymorpha pittospori]
MDGFGSLLWYGVVRVNFAPNRRAGTGRTSIPGAESAHAFTRGCAIILNLLTGGLGAFPFNESVSVTGRLPEPDVDELAGGRGTASERGHHVLGNDAIVAVLRAPRPSTHPQADRGVSRGHGLVVEGEGVAHLEPRHSGSPIRF